MSYVLYEPFSSERQGVTLCFAGLSGIGPYTSPDPSEWVRFPSKSAANMSSALRHSLTFYEPRPENELPEEESDA